ncbi:hypothetical protein LSUE1_G005900 [Lachnellula suecica]|uniref:Uncharacterized protein n=1 Tax=Lachnellula suecica TaxID=602035 RepID=A0A8T9C134_9HELO|nr:hypothetical protein LSUE1_G005900 [Lachnellula suecica]
MAQVPAAKDSPPGLPNVTRHITTHDSSGKAIVHSSKQGSWTTYDDNSMAFNVIYTTSTFPPSLNADADIHAHESLMSSQKLGLVNPKGSVLRMVDFAPGFDCLMHRTQSLDYGIVLTGSIEMVLDDGSATLMGQGDVAVQRATMHSWRNPSKTEWARMIFVLQDCQPVKLNDKILKEDLGPGTEGLPPSGNDVEDA